ncbi:Beta-TrCP [Orbilia brochopaga]|nr:Beta-TrCP [Drechslerella brochopaga]
MAQTPPPYEDPIGTISESEAQKSESLREPQQSNGTVTPVKRSHDLAVATLPDLNSAPHHQRTKRAKTAGALDENAMVIDGIGLPDTTSEEVRATIGTSVGVQADEYIQLDHESAGVYRISPQDPSLDSSARTCKFSPLEGKTLAVSYEDCHLLEINDDLSLPSRTVKDVQLQQQSSEEMSTTAWSNDGEYLATASWDGVIKIWDSRGRILHSFTVHRAPILGLKFHPTKSNLLLSVDGHSQVNVWDAAAGKLRKTCELTKTSDKNTPHDADWIDESTIIIVGDNGALWKPTQQKPVGVLEGHQDEISSLELSHGSNSSESLLGSSSADGHVRIWNIENRVCLHVLNMQSPVNVISFTADGRYMAAGAESLLVMIWRTETGQLAGTYDGKKGDDNLSTESTMEDLSWNKGGSRLAIAIRDQKCAIIDWANLLEEATAKTKR